MIGHTVDDIAYILDETTGKKVKDRRKQVRLFIHSMVKTGHWFKHPYDVLRPVRLYTVKRGKNTIYHAFRNWDKEIYKQHYFMTVIENGEEVIRCLKD